jgi:voltage-gated potassium channel
LTGTRPTRTGPGPIQTEHETFGLDRRAVLPDSRRVLWRDARTLLCPWTWDPVFRRSLLLLGLVLGFGTAGYSLIEGWSIWESFFFTLITVTTVGYGDHGVSPEGESFTALVMVGGIATASYCLAQIVQSITQRALHPETRVMNQISRLSGHHIVCGVGRMGMRIIERLESEGHVVVAIDTCEETVERLRDRGLLAMRGDATIDATLMDAGIERAATLAAVTPSDSSNAMVCLTANALAPGLRLISRAEDASSSRKLRRAGASSVLSPTVYGGDGIAEFMARPTVAELMYGRCGSCDDHEHAIRFSEFVIAGGSAYVGRPIRAVGADHPKLSIVGLRRFGGEIEMRPDSGRTLGEGDTLLIVGQPVDFAPLRDAAAA